MKKGINNEPAAFAVIFIVLFALFYFFNKFCFSITQAGPHYNAFFAVHLNYIQGLRHLLLQCSAQIIDWLGYMAIINDTEMLVAGHGVIVIVYTCLGLGLMSFFAAFVIAYPKPTKAKLLFLFSGLFIIQLLNVMRFVLLSLFWDKKSRHIADHHTIFNLIIYIIIALSLYLWIRDDRKLLTNAKN